MARAATARLKVNPPLGRMPALQNLLPSELKVDPAYQRSLDTGPSQSLIRKIAMQWNWDLCQPLVVARRDNGELYVIDGQHRLEAARLRGDIGQLPAVVVSYASAADEAASFVHLNQQRRPLSKLDVFKAAVASEDPEACAIVAAIEDAGLSIAPHSNHTAWKPGQVSNIGGIEAAWRKEGPAVTRVALRMLAEAWRGKVLQYAGTVFPGIVEICAVELAGKGRFDDRRFERCLTMLTMKDQKEWRSLIYRAKGENSNLRFPQATALVLRDAWSRANGESPPRRIPVQPVVPASPAARVPGFTGRRWCDQCEMQVDHTQASGCKSRWCSIRKVA